MKTAVIYARYSSDKQTEQSIEGQLYDCYNYAKQHGITVVREYIDRAMTGKNDDRPAFQQMLHESAMHKWDSVIVWKLDRFARNTIDSAVNRQILAKNGVKLLSVMESFGDDASGQMMTHIIEAINEYYSADLREKTIRGMRQSAMKAQTTGHIPLGYKVVDKKLVIDDETRIIPETVFRMYAEGERLTDIADHLNAQGYRNRRGRPFTTNSFYNMLANEKYIGIYKYDDIVIEGGIPQMIPNEVFEAVREKLITNRKRAAKNTAKADYYLSGKLYCGHCGEPMSGLSGTGRNGVKHYYYRCNGVQKKSGCHKKLENKYLIEDEVCRAARSAFEQMDKAETAETIYQMYLQTVRNEYAPAELGKELTECTKQAENVVNAIAQTGGNQLLFDKVRELEERKEQLGSALRLSQAMTDNVPSVEQITVFIDDILATDINTTEGKKAIADIMISKVYVYDDKLTAIFKDKDGKSVDIPLSDVSDSSSADCAPSALGSQSSFNLNLLKGKESNVCTYLLLLNRSSFFIDLLRINNFLCEK